MSAPKLTLRRDKRGEAATQGALYLDGRFLCFTLELPWLDNVQNISCVPEGTYPVVMERSGHFKMLLPELKNVPGRSEVKFHAGNTVDEIRGCILVGTGRGGTRINPRVNRSRDALATLLGYLCMRFGSLRGGETCDLEIRNEE